MNWRTLLGPLLLVAAVTTGWIVWRDRPQRAADTESEAEADFILHDFEIVALDAQTGKESMTLRAPEMHRNRVDQTSDITTPVFLLPDNTGLQWTLRAKTGWVSPKGDELRLRDDVQGDSPVAAGVVPTTFRTTALDVFPKQNLAKTDQKVTMTRPGIMQSGVGFQANLKTKQYQLLSQVKTRYEPNLAR